MHRHRFSSIRGWKKGEELLTLGDSFDSDLFFSPLISSAFIKSETDLARLDQPIVAPRIVEIHEIVKNLFLSFDFDFLSAFMLFIAFTLIRD